MRILLAVFAGLLVSCGIVIVDLRGDLQREHQVNAEQRSIPESIVSLRDEQLAKVDPAAPSAKPESLPVAAILQQLVSTPPSPEAAQRLNEDSRELPQDDGPERSSFIASTIRALARARNDPEYQAAQLAQTRMEYAESHPDVAEALGLTSEEADRLFNLLAERRTNERRSNGGFSRGSTDVTLAWEASLAALLGPARQARWQEYQQTRGFRLKALSLGSELADAGLPLSGAQRQAVTAAIVAEEKQLQLEREMLRKNHDRASAQDEMRSFDESAPGRTINAAAPYLSVEQFAQLRTRHELNMTFNRVVRRLQQEDALLHGAVH